MTTAFQKKLMRRIYFMYMVRKAISRRACQMYVFLSLWAVLFSAVSVTSVIANMPSQPLSLVSFATNALMHTELAVQVMLLALASVVMWMLVDTVQNARMQVGFHKVS